MKKKNRNGSSLNHVIYVTQFYGAALKGYFHGLKSSRIRTCAEVLLLKKEVVLNFNDEHFKNQLVESIVSIQVRKVLGPKIVEELRTLILACWKNLLVMLLKC